MENDFNNLRNKIFNVKEQICSKCGLNIISTQDARILFLDTVLGDLYACQSLLIIFLDAKSNKRLSERINIPFLSPKSEKEKAESIELPIINFLRLSLLNSFYFRLDNFLSNLFTSIDNNRPQNFTESIKLLLSKRIISKEEEKPLIVLSLIRNFLHNNGISRRTCNEIKKLKIKGIEYKIKKDGVINCSSWRHILNLINVIIISIENILTHEDIKNLLKIKDDFANTYE